MARPTFDQIDASAIKTHQQHDALECFMSAFRKMFADGVPMSAGSAAIGSFKDGGCGLTTSLGVTGARFTSADQSGSAASITDAPTTGQKIVLTDIILSSDTALRLDLKEETSGTILASIYMGAGTTVNVVTRGKLKLATANKKLQIQASAAGNISATAIFYSEA